MKNGKGSRLHIISGERHLRVDVIYYSFENNIIMANNPLTGRTIASSYVDILHVSGGIVYLGSGEEFTIDVSGSVDWNSVQNIPVGIISSSNQVDYTQLQNLPVIPDVSNLLENASLTGNILTFTREDGSTFDITIPTGSNGGGSGVSSYNDLIDIPVGIVSSSTQIEGLGFPTNTELNTLSSSLDARLDNIEAGATDWNDITSIPAGLISSSQQVDYNQIQNQPVIPSTEGLATTASLNSVSSSFATTIANMDDQDTTYEFRNGIKVLNNTASIDYDTITNLVNRAPDWTTVGSVNDSLLIQNANSNEVFEITVKQLMDSYGFIGATASSSFDSRIDTLENAPAPTFDDSHLLTTASYQVDSSSFDSRISANNTKAFQNEAGIVALGNTQTTLSSSFDARLDELEGANYIPLTEAGHTTTNAGDYKGDILELPTATLELGKIYAYNQGTFDLPVVHSGSSNVDDSLIVGAINVDSLNGVLTRGTFTTSQSLSGITDGSPLYFESGSGLLITTPVVNVGDVDLIVGHVLDNTTNLIFFNPSTAKKKEDEVIIIQSGSGSGGGITPTDPEIAYQRLYPCTDRTSYTIGDTAWHIQNQTYDYLVPSGNNITFAQIDNHASESQVRTGTFYGIVGDGTDLLGPTILKEDNAFGNKYRFTDDLGNPSDSTTGVIHQHVHFRNHSFTGATDGYVIDHLTGLGFNINYYQSGSAFNMRASDGGVNWETWMDYIANANYLGYTDWRPYSVSEMVGTALGAYIAGGGLQNPWSDDFFTGEATQGGASRFTCLTGETTTFNTTQFIYGEDTNVVDLTDDLTKLTGTTFTHRIMNCFMVRTHY